MQSFQRLHQKTRRSHSIDPKDLELCMLEYAQLCCDQLEVYSYMEENKIGIHNVDYWLAKARYFESERDYANVLSTLNQARRLYQVRSQHRYRLLQDYELALENRLEFLIRSYTRGKRSIADYETLSCPAPSTLSSPIPSCRHRTIGNTVVFVDRDCRDVYKLESLVELYNKKCGFDREFQMNRARRDRALKPLSWISEKNRKLSEMGRMLGVHNRVSHVEGREEAKEGETMQEKRVSLGKRNDSGCKILVQTPNPKLKELQERDSAEILLENIVKRKSLLFSNKQIKSPKFSTIAQNASSAHKHFPQLSQEQQKSAEGIEHFRCEAPPKQELFSFRIDSKTQRDITFNKNQCARIEDDSVMQESEFNQKDQANLKDLFREVQLQRYEPSLQFQPIDSQKENRIQQPCVFQRFERRQSRPALTELKIQQCTDPEVLNRILNKQIDVISEDSLLNLEALLELQPDSSTRSTQVTIDSLGFQRPTEHNREHLLLSERQQRHSVLSTISEEAPASEMKYHHQPR